MITSSSTVSVAPSSNEEAGDYEVKAFITYLGETQEVSSFTITVLEVVAEVDKNGEITTSFEVDLGFEGLTIDVDFDY